MAQIGRTLNRVAYWAWHNLAELDVVPARLHEPPPPKED